MHDDCSPIDAETEQMLEDAYQRVTRIDPQLRRFARVLADLGAPVPAAWASQHEPGSVQFGDLTAAQFDRLLCLLEDLAANRPVSVTIMRGGPTLFDPGPPSGPVAPPATSSVHMVVPK